MAYIRENKNLVPGDELWLFIGPYDPEEDISNQTASPVMFATQASLNRSLSTTSVSSKDHGNTSYTIPGEGSWTVSTECLYSVEGFDDVNDLFTESELVYIEFGKINETVGSGIVDVDDASEWTMAEGYLYGIGYITSLQASGSHGDQATFSAEITGVGPLRKDAVTPKYNITCNFDDSLTDENYGQGTLSCDKVKAAAGETVTIECEGSLTSIMVDISSEDVSLTPGQSIWTFTMPSKAVTITADRKYNTEIWTEYSSHYNTQTQDGTITSYFAPGELICVKAENSAYGPTGSYNMTSDPSATWTWDGTSYFSASMPDLYNDYGTSYTYLAIIPVQGQE